MKKIILSTVIVVSIATSLITSCRKEVPNLQNEIGNNDVRNDDSDTSLVLLTLGDEKNGSNQLTYDSEFGVTTARGMLVFRSSNDYWNAVQTDDDMKLERFVNLIDNLGYTSFEKSIADDQTSKDTLYTGLMPKMINEKESIIIGRNIYKINMQEEKVYTMPAAAINEVNELHIQNAMNKKIKAYSTQEDVIDIVEKGLFGCGEGCASKANQTLSGASGYGGRSFEWKMKIKYFHFGIGTDMDAVAWVLNQTETKVVWDSSANDGKGEWVTTYETVKADKMYIFGAMYRKYKIKCGAEATWWRLPDGYAYATSLRMQSYNLRKCLTKYYAKANFQFKFLSTDPYHYFDPSHTSTNYPLLIQRGY